MHTLVINHHMPHSVSTEFISVLQISLPNLCFNLKIWYINLNSGATTKWRDDDEVVQSIHIYYFMQYEWKKYYHVSYHQQILTAR